MTQKSGRPIRVLELGGAVALFGAERWILALVKNINRSAIETFVAALRDSPGTPVPLCDNAKGLGLSTAIIDAPGRFSPQAVTKLRKVLLEREIQIIHTHGYKQDIVALLAAYGTRCRVVATPHGWTHKADPKLLIYEWLSMAVFPCMDAVVPLSDDMFRILARFPFIKRKLRIIRNGVDLDELLGKHEEIPELIERKRHGSFLVGYVGRLIKAKGIETLVRAVALQNHPDVHLLLIGTGPDEAFFRKLTNELRISNRVHFFGYREDRLSFFKSFDLFVLPSFSEGIPRCMMEAMGLGLPVVASDIPGCRALVSDGVTERLVPPGDEISLAKALEEMHDNAPLRDDLGKRGSLRIAESFSAARMAQQYEELFIKICAAQSRPHARSALPN
jgi:glycosyltransferase involved in cell wall biosynthesis